MFLVIFIALWLIRVKVSHSCRYWIRGMNEWKRPALSQVYDICKCTNQNSVNSISKYEYLWVRCLNLLIYYTRWHTLKDPKYEYTLPNTFGKQKGLIFWWFIAHTITKSLKPWMIQINLGDAIRVTKSDVMSHHIMAEAKSISRSFIRAN